MAENSAQTQSSTSTSSGGGGGYQSSAILGSSILSGISSSHAVKRAIRWERERAQNAHQWEVQDLIKAGLNPILSAGGSGAVTGSIDTTNEMEPIAQGAQNAVNNALERKRLELELKKQNADIENQTNLTNAEVAQANANTARTIALMPEEIATHRFNRSGRIKRELGEQATEQATELIKTAGDRAGTTVGNIENSANAVKTKAKKSWVKNVQEYNKEHENDDQPSKWKNYNPLKIRKHYD